MALRAHNVTTEPTVIVTDRAAAKSREADRREGRRRDHSFVDEEERRGFRPITTRPLRTLRIWMRARRRNGAATQRARGELEHRAIDLVLAGAPQGAQTSQVERHTDGRSPGGSRRPASRDMVWGLFYKTDTQAIDRRFFSLIEAFAESSTMVRTAHAPHPLRSGQEQPDGHPRG